MGGEIVLIQGDSLPLPRESVQYTETWPGRLRASLDIEHVANLSASEKTIADVNIDHPNFSERELELYRPSTVILQIGIVDCAPRYLTQTQKQLVDLLPKNIFSKGVRHMVKKLRTRSHQRAYVSRSEFRRHVQQYVQRCLEIDVDQVLIIKIMSAGEKYLSRNKRVGEAISEYNERLSAVASEYQEVTAFRPLADTKDQEKDIVDSHTLPDGFHLNATGHELLFERLMQRLAP